MDGAANTRLHTPAGDFDLRRYPARPDETLQAWCAADLLLLEAASAEGNSATLVVNDEHGALAIGLGARASWTDSALAAIALGENLERNQLPSIPVVYATEAPPVAQSVVLRVPKQLAYFEYQLRQLAAHLSAGTPVFAGGMDKHLSPHTAALMEAHLGATERHRGRHKARIFSSHTPGSHPAGQGTGTTSDDWTGYHCAALDAQLAALPNVFSRDRLDGGSELLIAQLAKLSPVTQLTDLACGNGVLGLAALSQGVAQQVLFCDESAMAIASARRNLQRLYPQAQALCGFHHGDGLRNLRDAQAELVLCNPPFHLQHTVDDFAGRRLISQAARHLAPSGRLCLVANRHLRYRPALARAFAKVEQLASDSRFTVWLAQAPLT